MTVSREVKTPLYMQVHSAILNAVKTGEFARGRMLPAEKDLASKYQVDRQTIRRSLELLVEEGIIEKRAGVGSFVKDYPESPSRGDSAGTIAFILPGVKDGIDRITEPFNAKLFSSIEKLCRAGAFHLTYTTVARVEHLDRLPAHTAGVLAVSHVDQAIVDELHRRGVPTVVVNDYRSAGISILEDSFNGAMAGVSHLIELGHRCIGFIGGPEDYVTSQERYTGYIRALADADQPWHTMPRSDGDWSFDGGYRAMQSILRDCDPVPTAVFAANDVMAFGAVHAIADAGMAVPRDISVLGFDDIDQCRYSIPPLTTISVDVELMARVATINLFRLIEQPADEAYKIIIPTRLVPRESTAAPVAAAAAATAADFDGC